MRPLAAFAALLLLAACAVTDPPPPAKTEAPHLAQDAFVASDGARLPMRAWLPAGEPKAVIVALHGFNDYSNAFALPAPALVARGIAVYAYDQRGFGAAPDPGRWAGEAALVADADAFLRLVGARHPGVPLYLLGESMGGAVAMLAMTRPDAPKIAGMILSAPAVWARSRMSVVERAALWLTSHALPWFPVNGQGLDIQPSDNIPMLRALSRDPLVLKNTRVDTLDGLVDLMDDAYEAAPALKGPALILYGEHDEIVPARPTYDVMATIAGRPRIALAVYAKGYHMLLRDLEADTVVGDIIAWIAHPDAPLPSGADRRALTVLAEQHPKPIAAAAEAGAAAASN